MADDAKNAAPHGTPEVPDRIVAGFRAAIEEPESHEAAYVDLVVAGGMRGESYEFEFHADASGRTASRMRDELHDRHYAARELEPDRGRFAALARSIDIEALLAAESPAARFPPDSVVGRLEVSDGEQTLHFTFLADPEQAERVQSAVPPPLRNAVDAVYDTAAGVLGAEELRP